MVCFVDQYQLEEFRIKFEDSVSWYNTLNTRNCDICSAARFNVAHLNLDSLRGVGISTMLRSLLDQFLTMGQNKSAIGFLREGFDAINQLRKDDLEVVRETFFYI